MKITVNQLRKIIREEVQKTVRLNEMVDNDHPFVSLEQRAELDKLVKYPDLSNMFRQEEMANALISKNYKDIPKIMGAQTFDDPKVFDALRYMFRDKISPSIDRDSFRSWKEAWRFAGPLANGKGLTLSRPTPQDSLGAKLKA